MTTRIPDYLKPHTKEHKAAKKLPAVDCTIPGCTYKECGCGCKSCDKSYHCDPCRGKA